MYKKIILLLLVFFSLLHIIAQKTQSFPVKSGLIIYKFAGRGQGTEIVYFDDYGKLLSVFKTTSLLSGHTTEMESIHSIIRNDTLFEIDSHNNTICISDVCNHLVNSKLISPKMITTLGYNKLGSENVAGINCIKYTGNNGNLWVWDNIVLKSEMEIMDINISSEAIMCITDTVIPKSKFEIPNNYKIIN